MDTESILAIFSAFYLRFGGKEIMKDNNSLKIRALIVSDRLFDQAKVLADYLRRTKRIEVAGLAKNKQQALEIAGEQSFDYLIVAGYLESEYTYDLISELQKQQRKFLTVQWSMLDSLITVLCQRYKIPLQFERTRSMEDFVRFLEAHKNDPFTEC